MDERQSREEEASDDPVNDLRDNAADDQDPESSAASEPPPGQEPGEGKSHDL